MTTSKPGVDPLGSGPLLAVALPTPAGLLSVVISAADGVVRAAGFEMGDAAALAERRDRMPLRLAG